MSLEFYISVRHVAERLGYHPHSIYRLIKSGKIPATRLNLRLLIPENRVQEIEISEKNVFLKIGLRKTIFKRREP